jgi:hypothetical protein
VSFGGTSRPSWPLNLQGESLPPPPPHTQSVKIKLQSVVRISIALRTKGDSKLTKVFGKSTTRSKVRRPQIYKGPKRPQTKTKAQLLKKPRSTVVIVVSYPKRIKTVFAKPRKSKTKSQLFKRPKSTVVSKSDKVTTVLVRYKRQLKSLVRFNKIYGKPTTKSRVVRPTIVKTRSKVNPKSRIQLLRKPTVTQIVVVVYPKRTKTVLVSYKRQISSNAKFNKTSGKPTTKVKVSRPQIHLQNPYNVRIKLKTKSTLIQVYGGVVVPPVITFRNTGMSAAKLTRRQRQRNRY